MARTFAKHTTLLSVRVTESERARLAGQAGDLGLSAYVRGQLFGTGTRSRAPRQPQAASRDAAKALSLLGSSEVLKSLQEMSEAAKIGVLPVTPETEQLIADACAAVLQMRRELMASLGVADEECF